MKAPKFIRERIVLGSRRIVFLFDRWAIKVPLFSYASGFGFRKGIAAGLSNAMEGLRQNRRELSYPSDPRCCPVTTSFFRGLAIVMPKADRIATAEEWEASVYEEWCDVTTDIAWHNWGWFGDKMLLVDYGKE